MAPGPILCDGELIDNAVLDWKILMELDTDKKSEDVPPLLIHPCREIPFPPFRIN